MSTRKAAHMVALAVWSAAAVVISAVARDLSTSVLLGIGVAVLMAGIHFSSAIQAHEAER